MFENNAWAPLDSFHASKCLVRGLSRYSVPTPAGPSVVFVVSSTVQFHSGVGSRFPM